MSSAHDMQSSEKKLQSTWAKSNWMCDLILLIFTSDWSWLLQSVKCFWNALSWSDTQFCCIFFLLFWFSFSTDLIKKHFCTSSLLLLYWMIIRKLFFLHSWFMKQFSLSSSLWTTKNKLHTIQLQLKSSDVLKFRVCYWFF